MPVNQRLKNVISEIKYRTNLNQKGISDKIGVGYSYLSDLISGRYSLSEDISDRICKIFPVNRDYIMGMSDDIWMVKDEPLIAYGNYNGANTDEPLISISLEAWEVIKMQAKSLEQKDIQIKKRDEQLDRVIALLESILEKPNKNS